MRSIWRTLPRDVARDVVLVCLADLLVGASYGAITVASGLPLWLPVLLSLVVFAGASQFAFVALVGGGGDPFAAVLAGLLLNARHLPFGFAVADVFGGTRSRLLGAHLMIDENVAFTVAQDDPARRRAVYWACGAGLFVCWNLGVLAGAFAGTVVSDTDRLGLDAAFPAVLLALLLPSLRERGMRLPAAAGAVLALAATPWVPAGVPVLLALAGLAFARALRQPAEYPEATETPATETPETTENPAVAR